VEKHQEGLLNVRSKWKDFLKTVLEDERYKNMVAPQQMGSLPSELFGDYLSDLEEEFHQDKKKVKEILKVTCCDAIPDVLRNQDFLSLQRPAHKNSSLC
jgi:hypothetical protein